MAERPILFSGRLVRAILDGRKTVTRRPVKGAALDWLAHGFTPDYVAHHENHLCPYGAPGDRLWVREQHSMLERDSSGTCGPVWYWADGEAPAGDWTRPRPSIHMPRWASRLTLEVVSVRVERLQAITRAEVAAEGLGGMATVDEFAAGWDGLYSGKPEYRWAADPWVWRVEFKRVEPTP